MSESDSRHMDDTKLLTFIDRELDAAEAIRVDEHLASCEMCRSRLVDLRSDLDDLITRHRERKIATAPPPRPWADMSTEFDRLDGARSRLFPARAWLGVAAAALLAGVFWNSSTEHTVSAAELLDKASREAPTEPGRRITIKTRRESFVRPARMSSETQPAMADLEALFNRANFSWEDPLSARAFARWRDRLPDKQDEVTLVGSGGQLYRIRTTTSHGVLSEVILTVRANDLRPLDETLRFTNELVEHSGDRGIGAHYSAHSRNSHRFPADLLPFKRERSRGVAGFGCPQRYRSRPWRSCRCLSRRRARDFEDHWHGDRPRTSAADTNGRARYSRRGRRVYGISAYRDVLGSTASLSGHGYAPVSGSR